jgi:hypothetical protein
MEVIGCWEDAANCGENHQVSSIWGQSTRLVQILKMPAKSITNFNWICLGHRVDMAGNLFQNVERRSVWGVRDVVHVVNKSNHEGSQLSFVLGFQLGMIESPNSPDNCRQVSYVDILSDFDELGMGLRAREGVREVAIHTIRRWQPGVN